MSLVGARSTPQHRFTEKERERQRRGKRVRSPLVGLRCLGVNDWSKPQPDWQAEHHQNNNEQEDEKGDPPSRPLHSRAPFCSNRYSSL
jgi:hypothetical protein